MSKIDPEMLDTFNGRGWEYKLDPYGQTIAWKGPWLPDWFDNRPECHRANQDFYRKERLRKEGLNEHAQTPEQVKAFEDRRRVQTIRKQKAEAALLASEKFEGGK